ncbi:MAG: DUF192 domain-containing protein [Chloroflexaceae bacterium]|nr:DUF192 domain-containing protein [Chloroflexaceae bacterium]
MAQHGRFLRVENTTRNQLIAAQCAVADTFGSRLRGLMGRTTLEPGHGLLILPEWSIHTFFMRFAIDVIFLSTDYTVLKVREAMPPNLPYAGAWGAHAVLELPAGVIAATGTQAGDQLHLSPATVPDEPHPPA